MKGGPSYNNDCMHDHYVNRVPESCAQRLPEHTLIILRGKRLRRISSLCAPLFAAKPMMWAVALSGLVIVATMLPLILSEDRFLPWSGIEQAIGLLIALMTLVAHEIGHAAAAMRHGREPIQIGLVLHRRVFPAIFADIMCHAPPSRSEVIVIALAGCTAQLILAAVLCLLILALPSAIGALSMAVLAAVALTFAQLIPCYGSDGAVAFAALRSE